MILNKEAYWGIMDYVFKNLHFIEECMNPSEMINIDTTEEKNVWLGDLIKEYESEKCPREAILSALHILLTRDLVKVLYVAQKKDYRLIDLTSKGYEEYLDHMQVL
ncbi:MAG: hypothetical protein K6G82_07485 [Ruminococcus sp.]|nr:hypothetical protein [Ruminococcus sp.]